MRTPLRPGLSLAPLAGARTAWTRREHGNVSLTVGGGDPVAARRALGPLVGAAPEATVFMQQVHGAGVARVTAEHAGRGAGRHADALAGVDALVTETPDLPLAVLTADCVPVLFVRQGAVGAAHAGREGLLAGVLEATLGALEPLGDGPVTALLGPAIGPCCYEVPAGLAEAAEQRLPGIASHTSWGGPSLDLPGTAAMLLARQGLRVGRVDACTRCAPEVWFSHRAVTDGRQPTGDPGRQASVVALTPGDEGRPDEDGLPWPLEWLS